MNDKCNVSKFEVMCTEKRCVGEMKVWCHVKSINRKRKVPKLVKSLLHYSRVLNLVEV